MRLLLAAAAAHAIRGRVYPVLHDSTYEDDFVHDDQAHPAEAVKINIAASHQRLADAAKSMDELAARLAAAKEAYQSAAHVYEAHVAETGEAQDQVAHWHAALADAPETAEAVEEAKANLSAAVQRLNQSDIDATAAAQLIHEAALDFHSSNVDLVEAREDVSARTGAVKHWTKKIAEAHAANASFVEWVGKLNASATERLPLAAELARARQEFVANHTAHKQAAVRLAEAKKLFDVDKATYEELIGPYGDAPAAESLWWDALSDNEWSADLEAAVPNLNLLRARAARARLAPKALDH